MADNKGSGGGDEEKCTRAGGVERAEEVVARVGDAVRLKLPDFGLGRRAEVAHATFTRPLEETFDKLLGF